LSYFLRHVVHLIGVLLFLVAVLVVKVTSSAKQEFAIGEEAYTRGAYEVAITHYERAIKWYTPFSKTVRHAVEHLWQLGTEAEMRGDWHLALTAYQSLRASLYAVQSLYIPYYNWIPKTEERIAPLLAKIKAGEEPNTEKLGQDTARFAMQLQQHVGPYLGWSILVEVGFLGWVGTTVGLIWYVTDEAGNFARRRGLLWGSLIVVFFALWLLGMRLA
jgi:hypothetical protein